MRHSPDAIVPAPFLRCGALLLAASLAAGAASPARCKEGPPAERYAHVPAFSVSGRYAEVCTDPPLCGAWFDAASSAGPCRKIMLFQFQRSQYGAVPLNNVTALVAVESAEGAPITVHDREGWARRDLVVSETADSAVAAALRDVLALMLWGGSGSEFTSVRSLPLAVGISEAKIVAESGDRIRVRARPFPSPYGRAPEVVNIGSPFPYLATPHVYRGDTLSYAVPGEGAAGDAARWTAARCSAALTLFTWSRDGLVRELPVRPE